MAEECNEYTVDFWFKREKNIDFLNIFIVFINYHTLAKKRFPPIHIVNKWPDVFNWNDRKKTIYK